jgi:NFU1 iron-sulfur cluster scaffold homolog, mitochondrial
MTNALHVERTADPAVLRWVTHDPSLGTGDRCPDADSNVGGLREYIAHVAVSNGDVLIRAADASEWPDLVTQMHDALAADIANSAAWMRSPTVAAAPTVDDVQRTVEQSIGDLLAAHGGQVEVVSVATGTAVVRLHGACRGCSGADTTVHERIRAAVLVAHPTLTDVQQAGKAPSRIALVRSARSVP